MMIPETGARVKVKGRRRATLPAGPIPGNTPMSVPMKTPAKQRSRLAGVKTTEKPKTKFCRISIFYRPLKDICTLD
jgi:hypothetical protein